MKSMIWICLVAGSVAAGCTGADEPPGPTPAAETAGPATESPAGTPSPAPARPEPPPEATFVEVLPSGGPLQEQLAAEAADAAASGRRPFVYACSTILPPSVAIDSSLEDPLMKDAFAGTHIVRVDVHEWGAPEAEPLVEGNASTWSGEPWSAYRRRSRTRSTS